MFLENDILNNEKNGEMGMLCKNCGNQVNPEARICSKCGTMVENQGNITENVQFANQEAASSVPIAEPVFVSSEPFNPTSGVVNQQVNGVTPNVVDPQVVSQTVGVIDPQVVSQTVGVTTTQMNTDVQNGVPFVDSASVNQMSASGNQIESQVPSQPQDSQNSSQNNKKKKKNNNMFTIIAIVVVIVVAAGGIFLVMNNGKDNNKTSDKNLPGEVDDPTNVGNGDGTVDVGNLTLNVLDGYTYIADGDYTLITSNNVAITYYAYAAKKPFDTVRSEIEIGYASILPDFTNVLIKTITYKTKRMSVLNSDQGMIIFVDLDGNNTLLIMPTSSGNAQSIDDILDEVIVIAGSYDDAGAGNAAPSNEAIDYADFASKGGVPANTFSGLGIENLQ